LLKRLTPKLGEEKMNLPFQRFHCIFKSYGTLLFYVPIKGWFVKYDDYGYQFMEHTPCQPKGQFHNCTRTGKHTPCQPKGQFHNCTRTGKY